MNRVDPSVEMKRIDVGKQRIQEVVEALQTWPWKMPAAKKRPNLDVLPEGQIVRIRFIRSNLKLDIFSETFPVPAELKYSHVEP